jgi:coronin-1B/1C/6
MRAYKTVNDTYIEPISFVVPRRAEVFQSDIYPPAVGLKPGVSASEWLAGKATLPPKIDLQSIYEGNGPVELPGEYKSPTAAPIKTPSKTAPPAKKELEPTPIDIPQSPPPTVSEQKGSIAAIASKFQDKAGDADDDGDETSSFEEIVKPVTRPTTISKPASKLSSPVATREASQIPVFQAVPRATTQESSSPPRINRPVLGPTSVIASTSSSSVEASLQQIMSILENQTNKIATQSEKISQLMAEVDTLKMRVGTSNQDQSERIRQLELELEAAKS